jgi:hypothetical protein
VKINVSALEYAPENLKNDREFVLEAVKNNASALEYAPENLKNDREIVLIALYKYRTHFDNGVTAEINPPVFKLHARRINSSLSRKSLSKNLRRKLSISLWKMDLLWRYGPS